MFTILHISDLHRSRDEPVDNATLMAALLADRDRYRNEIPAVPSPDAIVVSGDLIQGAAIGSSDWHTAMRDQYAVAGDFLDQLTRRFLGGDRSKLVIIPGNHDVCWNTSIASMARVGAANYPRDVHAALVEPDSNYRWSWKDRALYRIADPAAYAKRMDAYWDFTKNFYSSGPLLAGIDPTRGYQIFELCNRRIAVVAFDSITGNDCFGYSGAIPRGAVARADLALRDVGHLYNMRIAVWHHSVQGPPMRDDYMDVSQVHEMAGLGFQLGMHGHQHVAAASTHYVHLNEAQSMAVVSAGSLCAGARELPRGVNRQYNLIVIDDSFRRARVHVREMVEGQQFSRKSGGGFPEGYSEISWQAPRNLLGTLINIDQENLKGIVLKAEKELADGDPRKAVEYFEGLTLDPQSYARRLAVQAAIKTDDPKLVITTIGEPNSEEEAIFLALALVQVTDLEGAKKVLAAWGGIDVATRRAIEEKIKTKIDMRRAWPT